MEEEFVIREAKELVIDNEMLEEYNIKNLTLQELQKKYIILENEYIELEDEYYKLNKEYEELENYPKAYAELEQHYEEQLLEKDNIISYLKEHQETSIGSFFNDLIGYIGIILFIILITFIFSKIKEGIKALFSKLYKK